MINKSGELPPGSQLIITNVEAATGIKHIKDPLYVEKRVSLSNKSDDLLYLITVLCVKRAGPDVIKLISCSTQLSMKMIMLMNVKMPTTVGILTLISMTVTTSDSSITRKAFIFLHFRFYEQLKVHAQLS